MHRFALPKRWEMSLLLFTGIAVVYTLRVNMSVAAQSMRTELDWSEQDKGLVLSAFYWGYTVGQVPGSLYAHTFGAKWLYGLSIAIPSFLTLLMPTVCRVSLPLTLMMRCLIGLFESASFPALFHFFPLWIPANEKSFLIPFIVSGIYMGEIVGFAVSGILVEPANGFGGWPAVFYVFGFVGLLWFPLWMLVARESPALHPSISSEELHYLDSASMLSESGKDPEGTDDFPLDKSKNPGYEDSVSARKGIKEIPQHEDELDIAGIELPGTKSKKFSIKHSRGYKEVINPMSAAAVVPHRNSSNVDYKSRQLDPNVGSGKYMEKVLKAPWRHFLTHPTALSMMAANFQYGWMNFTLLSEMPSYLTDVLGFNIQHAGLLAACPYVVLFVSSFCFSKLYEYLQSDRVRQPWSVDYVRKHAQFIAYFCSGIALVACGFMRTVGAAYFLMLLTQLFFAANQAGLGCTYTDVAPKFSSLFQTLGNTLGSVAGILGPIIIALFTDTWPGVVGWRAAFILTLCLSCATLLLWFRYVRAEIVPLLNSYIDS